MKIHFCDLCNESVPQADLDEGRAFVRKGRVVCATCDRAMSHAGVAVAPSVAASAVEIAPAEPAPPAAPPPELPPDLSPERSPAPVLSAVSIAPNPPEKPAPARASSATPTRAKA